MTASTAVVEHSLCGTASRREKGGEKERKKERGECECGGGVRVRASGRARARARMLE